MFQLIRLQHLCRQLKWTRSLTRWQKTGNRHVHIYLEGLHVVVLK